jgi:hypothetical protein
VSLHRLFPTDDESLPCVTVPQWLWELMVETIIDNTDYGQRDLRFHTIADKLKELDREIPLD